MIAALWFALVAFLGSSMMYLAPSVQRDIPTVLLYLGCPTISGLVAGYLLGRRVFAARTSLRAAMVGILVVVLAFVVFAPLYVLTYEFVSDGSQRPLALLLSVLVVGLVITAPITVPLGAFAGCAWFWLGRDVFKKPHALDM